MGVAIGLMWGWVAPPAPSVTSDDWRVDRVCCGVVGMTGFCSVGPDRQDWFGGDVRCEIGRRYQLHSVFCGWFPVCNVSFGVDTPGAEIFMSQPHVGQRGSTREDDLEAVSCMC